MTDPVAPTPAPTPAPAGAPTQVLSLISFIAGLFGLVFSWVPILGFLASVAAIILGALARKREPLAPRWMWIVGIITGIVALVIGVIVVVFFIIGLLLSASAASLSTY